MKEEVLCPSEDTGVLRDPIRMSSEAKNHYKLFEAIEQPPGLQAEHDPDITRETLVLRQRSEIRRAGHSDSSPGCTRGELSPNSMISPLES